MGDPGSAFLAPSIDTRADMRCPACGAAITPPTHGSPDIVVTTLLAVCDVLVVKALEKMGTYIIRSGATRGRWREFDLTGKQAHEAHTIWRANDAIVSKALKGAWDVVPLILDTHATSELDPVRAAAILDRYVHDLAVTGDPHDFNTLANRLRRGLGLPVFEIVTAS